MFIDWIWSWIQGVQISCTIAQAQEFAWQWIHSDIDHPTSGGRGRRPLNAIAAARQRRQGQHPRRLRGLGKIPPPPRGGGAVHPIPTAQNEPVVTLSELIT